MLNLNTIKTVGPLADISIRFGNEQDQYVALKIFPLKPVAKAQFKFYQYDKSNLRVINAASNTKAEANEVQFGAFSTSAQARLRKLKGTVDPADERDADAPLNDQRTDIAMLVMDGLLIDYENLVYTSTISNSSNFMSGNSSTLGAGLTWADGAGDPVGNSKTARQQVKNTCGKYANCAAWSSTALEDLKIHPQLVDRMKYTSGTSLTQAMVQNLMEIGQLDIASAISNSAINEGATDSLGEIWGNKALFYYKATETPGLRTMHFGTTFIVNEFYTRTYQVPQLGGKDPLEKVESGWTLTPQLVALQDSSNAKAAAGYLLQGVF